MHMRGERKLWGTYMFLDNIHKVVCQAEGLERSAVNYWEMLDPITG